MIEKFFNIVPLLKEHEIPGRDSWNTLIEFIRGIQSTSPFLTFRTRQPTGMYIDLALEGILMATPQFAFGISPAQLGRQTGSLTISGGTVRWPDGGIQSISSQTISKSAGGKAWVSVSKSGASLNIGTTFPAWMTNIHTSSLAFNFPILELVADALVCNRNDHSLPCEGADAEILEAAVALCLAATAIAQEGAVFEEMDGGVAEAAVRIVFDDLMLCPGCSIVIAAGENVWTAVGTPEGLMRCLVMAKFGAPDRCMVVPNGND